mmetsp:Transcript_122778/g.354919  ORF Transcript_122778/g.354919 Transcript_122778/m.354919 type:complete len:197 (-) Transcript_122778:111-701(-)
MGDEELWQEFLRSYLVRFEKESVSVEDVMGSRTFTCLFFGGSWCAPSRQFAEVMTQSYRDIQRIFGRGAIEVIYVPRDSSAVEWRTFFSHMPWLSLPWGSHHILTLRERFSVSRLPRVVALNRRCEVVAEDARGLPGFGFGCDPVSSYHWLLSCERLARQATSPCSGARIATRRGTRKAMVRLPSTNADASSPKRG